MYRVYVPWNMKNWFAPMQPEFPIFWYKNYMQQCSSPQALEGNSVWPSLCHDSWCKLVSRVLHDLCLYNFSLEQQGSSIRSCSYQEKGYKKTVFSNGDLWHKKKADKAWCWWALTISFLFPTTLITQSCWWGGIIMWVSVYLSASHDRTHIKFFPLWHKQRFFCSQLKRMLCELNQCGFSYLCTTYTDFSHFHVSRASPVWLMLRATEKKSINVQEAHSSSISHHVGGTCVLLYLAHVVCIVYCSLC